MGTTKIKIIDLSSEEPEVKASQKRAQNLASINKLSFSTKRQKEEKKKPGQSDLLAESGLSPAVQEVKTPAVKKSTGQKKVHRHHLGAKYLTAKTKVERDKVYPAAEAFDLLTRISYTKFDPSVEIHLGVNAKSLRGTVNFPHAAGPKKEKKYLVFSDKKSDLKNVIWANENTIADIESAKLKPGRDFNAVIASPKFMPQLAKVAKILGPAGMMPNPKAGTVTENHQTAIESNTTSGTEYRTDPTAPIIHTKIGKLSEKPENLKANLEALIAAVGPQKIKKATLSSTMSPGIKIDVSTL